MKQQKNILSIERPDDQETPDSFLAKLSRETDGHTPSEQRLVQIPRDELKPDPRNPRQETGLNEEALEALMKSIERHGQIQPIVVTDRDPADNKYRIIAGERRWRAVMRSARVHTLTAVLRTADEPAGTDLVIQFLENAQRQDFSALEAALGVRQIIAFYGGDRERAGEQLGMSKTEISQRMALLDAPDFVREFVEHSNSKDYSGIYSLARVAKIDEQRARDIIAELQQDEGEGGDGLRQVSRAVLGELTQGKQGKAKKAGAPHEGGAGARRKEVAGVRGRAPLVVACRVDVAKAQPMLYLETGAGMVRYSLSAEAAQQLREAVSDLVGG